VTADDLLERSARYIDTGDYEGPVAANPVDGRLSELADGIAMVRAFSHVVAFRTAAGLVLFDTSLAAFGPRVRDSLREWSSDPVHTIVYTHGHLDHVGGARCLADEAADAGRPRPEVVAHEGVPERFDRYDLTEGYNEVVNARQFGGAPQLRIGGQERFGLDWVRPTVTYSHRLERRVGDHRFELRHARGETDDHTYAWFPEIGAVCAGDLVAWVFPNAGNPQKVQRYPREWARALREIAALEPDLLLPAHGLPVAGRDRIARLLDDAARALETLVADTLAMMNAGARLDEIVHTVRVPDDLLDRPYLRPVYDEPEFVVRNVWRLYGGWYDGNPARLKPPPDAVLAAEVARLAGGPGTLAARALEVAASGDRRLACQLAEWAAQAAPDDVAVRDARAEVYRQRRESELGLMARGIFGAAEYESRELPAS
jgi:alkyl sulfatase BDS1-like metallo-beta-lactamase superfamily hydrolase